LTQYLLGLDFGTDSVRAIIADSSNGTVISSGSCCYRRWAEHKYCDAQANMYRHHPLDYMESMEEAIHSAIRDAGSGIAERIAGIAADTTASTPVLIDRQGRPLAMLPQYEDNPDAMFVLWKDHTAIKENDEINRACKANTIDYSKYCGGSYSCEWVWAKMLHCLREDKSLLESTWSWVELCDWIPALLSGNTAPETLSRGRCAAGHKAMWNESWGGLPAWDFFTNIDPVLDIFKGHLYKDTFTADTKVGGLCREWADRLGLRENTAIALGGADCHVGAVGCGVESGTMVKIIGTSTCDLCVAPPGKIGLVKGICGQVDGSILPGYIGIEAGQSAFGDIFAWFSRFCGKPITELESEAAAIPVRKDDIVALDWFNGRRSPFDDPRAKAKVSGLTMATTPAQFYKALVEAAAFGSRAIFERFTEDGIEIKRILAAGGISAKSPYVVQTLSDVIGVKIEVPDSDQACALGAAMLASVAAGVHQCVTDAQRAMKPGIRRTHTPDNERHTIFNSLYEQYKSL